MIKNFDEVIEKKIEESRIEIAKNADAFARINEGFAAEYLMNVVNQSMFMLGNTLTRDGFIDEIERIKQHVLEALDNQ